jgi:lysophospholipid acyltransferase (LPLAT)-like uncharacterized protein
VSGATLAVTKYNNIVQFWHTTSFLWICTWEEYKKILAGFLSKFQKNLCHLSASYMTVLHSFYTIH